MKKQFVQKYFICFMTYAIIGWCVEVCIAIFIHQYGFRNRGILFGPYCPVYGFGALIFVFSLGWLMRKDGGFFFKLIKPLLVFLICALMATVIELITSYILEHFTGSWPWQGYKHYKYNYQSRIAPITSIGFGVGGVLGLYILQPLLNRILNKMKSHTIDIIFAVLLTTVVCDCIYTFILK